MTTRKPQVGDHILTDQEYRALLDERDALERRWLSEERDNAAAERRVAALEEGLRDLLTEIDHAVIEESRWLWDKADKARALLASPSEPRVPSGVMKPCIDRHLSATQQPSSSEASDE